MAPDFTLLTPIQVGSRELRNRVVSTAHGTRWAPWSPGGALERYIRYQRRRATGGVALIVTDAVWLEADETTAFDRLAGYFARFAEGLHTDRGGVAVVVQIAAHGAQISSDAIRPRGSLLSFNGMQSPTSGEPSHRMTGGEIEHLIGLHAHVAGLATEAGLDGVELLGAHGYLIHQSMSPWGNGRDDEWGHPLAFANAVIAAVRDAVGPDKILGFRSSVDDDRPPSEGGDRREELRDLARRIVEAGGVDYLNIGMGSRAWDYAARTSRSYRYPPGVDLALAAALRRAIAGKIPVIGVNRVITPEQAEEALRRGDCDLVAMTRAHIADPDVVSKVESGRSDRIRRCVGANECGNAVLAGLPLACIHNPDVGREEDAEIAPAPRSRRLAVVGAGPAGLKAAEIAARRGHDVTVFDAAHEPGGQLRHVRSTPAEELWGVVSWLMDEIRDLGVQLRLGTRLDAAALSELGPDVVVLATGATRRCAQPGPAIDASLLMSGAQALAGNIRGPVLVFDQLGDMEAVLVAETLLARGVPVTFATSHQSLAPRAGHMQVDDLRSVFASSGCEVLTEVQIERFSAGVVELITTPGRISRTLEVGTLVTVGAPQPDLALAPVLERMALPYHVIGDALAPRGARAAIRDGDLAGRAI